MKRVELEVEVIGERFMVAEEGCTERSVDEVEVEVDEGRWWEGGLGCCGSKRTINAITITDFWLLRLISLTTCIVDISFPR